jgi:hypothetical protein
VIHVRKLLQNQFLKAARPPWRKAELDGDRTPAMRIDWCGAPEHGGPPLAARSVDALRPEDVCRLFDLD